MLHIVCDYSGPPNVFVVNRDRRNAHPGSKLTSTFSKRQRYSKGYSQEIETGKCHGFKSGAEELMRF
ncbi:hypothetical protein TNCV_987781 [Trichonephila clavipes]|nr:hypothetical protein TNCV_987781 [Trichonephila clavipes]